MAFADTLKSKDFVVLVEMETPKGVDISGFVDNARHVSGRIDAALVPDMSYAVMRMSALAGAILLKGQGVEPIIQFSCRDRNRLALQADLLAAHVMGVANVMAVDGEPIEMGDHLQAKPVYDLSSVGFLEAAATLTGGRDIGGRELRGVPKFCIGARIEAWVDDAQCELRVDNARAAVNKGAQFLIAPPVFDVEAFAAFMSKAKDIGVPVIASVMLLKSVGMARYLNQNLTGVHIGEDIIKRIRQASDRPAECVKIAGETIKALKKLCGGVLLVTAGWENKLPRILDAAGC